MSLSEQVCPLLAARAATDPYAARLVEMFNKANELVERARCTRIGSVPGRQTTDCRAIVRAAPNLPIVIDAGLHG
jgi:thiazole synthase ThiGH ThiG subunit